MRYLIEIAIATILCSAVFFICDAKYSYRRLMKPIIAGIIIVFGSIISVTYYFEEPQFYLIGDAVVELEVKKPYEEKGAKAKYHMKNISSKIETSGDVNFLKVRKLYSRICIELSKLERKTIVSRGSCC